MTKRRDRQFLALMRRLAREGYPGANAILRTYLSAGSRKRQVMAISLGCEMLLRAEYKRTGCIYGDTPEGYSAWLLAQENAGVE